ncbi:family 20 glycosylhydrolase [Alteromonas gracilis]|uniref:family 20 glycosylhydrolase n=1 Tax=Alteromonas gracilis TaxID=1479524 RepID=UPI003735E15D
MRSILGLSLLLVACSPLQETNAGVKQPQLDSLGKKLTVQYAVLSNTDDTMCRVHIPNGDCFSSQITLQSSDTEIPASTSLFFSHIAPVRGFDTPHPISMEHINGDLHRITFDKAIAANTKVTITLSAPFWHASRSDAMPNYYLTYPSLTPVLVDSTTRVKEEGSNLLVNQHTTPWNSEAQYKRVIEDSMPLMNSVYLASKFSRMQTSNTPNVNKKGTDKNSKAHVSNTSLSEVNKRRVIPQVSERNDTGDTVAITGIAFDDSVAQGVINALEPALAQAAHFSLTQQDDGVSVAIALEPTKFEKGEYELRVSEAGIEINAKDTQGANYAVLTLAQLYNGATRALPITRIHDKPRFAFRGMHLDIARHFPGKDAIVTVIEQMFTYKLNKLHLHLSDDEGWRLAIDALPELTEIGAYRCHDLSEQTCLLPQLGSGPFKQAKGNGFLTQQDYIDILHIANQRGIEVIPSLDMPGHARAAIISMNARFKHLSDAGQHEAASEFLLVDAQDTTQYESVQFYSDNTINPCLDSTYHFINTIMGSVKKLHEQANVPLQYFHVGADETAGAWVESPQCKAKGQDVERILSTFVTRVQQIAKQHDIAIGGWSDGMEKAAATLDNTKAYTNVWHLLAAGGENTVSHFAKTDIPVVLSFPDVLYFDFPYQSNPYEPGYYWGSRATSTQKVFSLMPNHLSLHSHEWTDRMGQAYTSNDNVNTSSVVGIQGQLWSEVTVNQNAVEYMVFPRLLALAERAWHEAPWQQNARELDKESQLQQTRYQDWQSFENAMLTQHMPVLVEQGINVRVPMPAAVVRDGVLHMHVQPGLQAEYQVSKGSWQHYVKPVAVSAEAQIKVRARLEGTQKVSRQAHL